MANAVCRVRPTTRSARPGAVRTPLAPAALAASIKRCSDVASAWPKARPMPMRMCRRAADVCRSASLIARCDLSRRPVTWMIRSATAERNAAMPSAASNVARARYAAALRQDFEQTDGDFDAVSVGNAPSGAACRPSPPTLTQSAAAPSTASARRRMSAAMPSRWSAPPPSIDDRDFGGESLRRASSGESAAQSAASALASMISLRIETGERIGQNRNAVLGRDAERGDGGREDAVPTRRSSRGPGCCRAT